MLPPVHVPSLSGALSPQLSESQAPRSPRERTCWKTAPPPGSAHSSSVPSSSPLSSLPISLSVCSFHTNQRTEILYGPRVSVHCTGTKARGIQLRGGHAPLPTRSTEANHCPSAPCDSQMWLDNVDIHFLARASGSSAYFITYISFGELETCTSSVSVLQGGLRGSRISQIDPRSRLEAENGKE